VRWRGNLLAFTASMVLSLLFVESFLRVFPYVGLSASQRRELAWRKTHKTAEQILTRERYSFDTYSSELGWQLKPNLRTPGVNSNSKGLRGTREYLLEPPTGVRRVLCRTVPISLTAHRALQDASRLPFCYLCGVVFGPSDDTNRDHVPPSKLFAPADRTFPLLLRAHRLCNESRSSEDQAMRSRRH
jgi:hypothetical protein